MFKTFNGTALITCASELSEFFIQTFSHPEVLQKLYSPWDQNGMMATYEKLFRIKIVGAVCLSKMKIPETYLKHGVSQSLDIGFLESVF